MKKRLLSLLEIILVISIVLISSSVIGINIKKAITTYRIKREKKLVVESFLFAKKMAVANRCDIKLFLYQENKKLVLDMGISKSIGIFPNQKNKKEYFSNLYYKPHDTLEFIFTSNGEIYPKVVLNFYKDQGYTKKAFFVDLKALFLVQTKSF